eukprot:scaffold5938_cov257-Skeletonema_menzelii.AAC.1
MELTTNTEFNDRPLIWDTSSNPNPAARVIQVMLTHPNGMRSNYCLMPFAREEDDFGLNHS